jgi:hypothetical protein
MRFTRPLPLSNKFGLSAIGNPSLSMALTRRLPLSRALAGTLSVPRGTPSQVALDQEIRVKRVGQPVHALNVEPVYAFDRLVVPVGSQVIGRVTKIEAISVLAAEMF